MATITGSGFPQSLWGWFQGYFTILSADSNGFQLERYQSSSKITVTGIGLTYSDVPQGNGSDLVAVTGGIITGVTIDPDGSGSSLQTYTNLSVDGAAANAALVNQSAFNDLFFGGNDTITWQGVPVLNTLSAYGGNDTVTINNWGNATFGGSVFIDGGSGNDTLYVNGGVSGPGDTSGVNFPVIGFERINLGAGFNYNIVPTGLSVSGTTITIDGSALSASNSVSVQSFNSGGPFRSDIIFIGGAGNDTFQAGLGANTFIGNGGSDTVNFYSGVYTDVNSGVTANLGIAGFQSLGTGRGTASFSGIENVTGTRFNDTLIGNSSDNILNGGSGNDVLDGGDGNDTLYDGAREYPSGSSDDVLSGGAGNDILDSTGGNDVLIGGAGTDTAIIHGLSTDYTMVTAGGTTIFYSDYNGTFTLSGVEQIQFDDRTITPSNAGVTVIQAPTLTASNISVGRGQLIPLSSLFTIDNAANEAITLYQLWDGTDDPNSGSFGGGPARTIVTLTAAQLAQRFFITGKAPDTLQIRAMNAAGWSAPDNSGWTTFVVSPTESAPVVTTPNARKVPGAHTALANLVSVTDADGDPIAAYQLWDSTSDPASGHWVVNGVSQPAQSVITVTAAQAGSTYFVTGTVVDTLEIRAFDGVQWSAPDNAAWSRFTMTPAVNNPPVVTGLYTQVGIGQTASVASLFQVSDPDGDIITKYQMRTDTPGIDAGRFMVNFFSPFSGVVIEATPAQLASGLFVRGLHRYRGGDPGL